MKSINKNCYLNKNNINIELQFRMIKNNSVYLYDTNKKNYKIKLILNLHCSIVDRVVDDDDIGSGESC